MVGLGVTVKDVTSVLAVVSVESPSDCFVDQLFGNSLALVLGNELLDSLLDFDLSELLV